MRWRIVEILAAGEHSSGEVTEIIGFERQVERTAVTHHLRRLREEELILVRQDWSSRLYRLNPRLLGAIHLAIEGLEEMRVGGYYDDIVLRDDTLTNAEDHVNRDELRQLCWCIRKITDMPRYSHNCARMYTLEECQPPETHPDPAW